MDPDAGAQLTVGAASHASVAVGVTYATIAPVALVQSTAMFAGQVTAGPVTSRTVTVNVHVVALTGVAWSRAVQVTVVAPIANVEPDAGAQLTVGAGSQASVALGVT